MFDAAMEAIADDVANKVGEMERFMEISSNIMDSVDLQNGIFAEEGMKMLEDWEQKSTLLLMDGGTMGEDALDLDEPIARPEKQEQRNTGNKGYDSLFD